MRRTPPGRPIVRTAFAFLLGFAVATGSFVSMAADVCPAGPIYSRELDGWRGWTHSSPPPVTTYRRAKGLGVSIVGDEWAQRRQLKRQAVRYGLIDLEYWYPDDCGLGYAVKIFTDRRERFGEDHQYVEILKNNQRKILNYCAFRYNSPKPVLNIVEFSDENTNAIARHDFAYHQAAIDYYAFVEWRDATRSRARFEAIAGDSNSPHRAMAHFMVAQLTANHEGPKKATPLIEVILGDPSLRSVHRITRQLFDVMAYRSVSSQAADSDLLDGQIARIGEILSLDAAQVAASEDLKRQYAVALDDVWWFLNGGPPDGPRSAALERLSPTVPVLDWMRMDVLADRRSYWRRWFGADSVATEDETQYR